MVNLKMVSVIRKIFLLGVIWMVKIFVPFVILKINGAEILVDMVL